MPKISASLCASHNSFSLSKNALTLQPARLTKSLACHVSLMPATDKQSVYTHSHSHTTHIADINNVKYLLSVSEHRKHDVCSCDVFPDHFPQSSIPSNTQMVFLESTCSVRSLTLTFSWLRHERDDADDVAYEWSGDVMIFLTLKL
jgi:hypothetical protein